MADFSLHLLIISTFAKSESFDVEFHCFQLKFTQNDKILIKERIQDLLSAGVSLYHQILGSFIKPFSFHQFHQKTSQIHIIVTTSILTLFCNLL